MGVAAIGRVLKPLLVGGVCCDVGLLVLFLGLSTLQRIVAATLV